MDQHFLNSFVLILPEGKIEFNIVLVKVFPNVNSYKFSLASSVPQSLLHVPLNYLSNTYMFLIIPQGPTGGKKTQVISKKEALLPSISRTTISF